jgi:hypothetical protein
MTGVNMVYHLVVGGQTYPIDVRPLRIGRSADNDVVLSYPAVSRNHAVIWTQGGQIYVRDVGSANGTWVNGEPVLGDVAVRSGDRLQVGQVDLLIQGSAAQAVPVTEGGAPAVNIVDEVAPQLGPSGKRYLVPAVLIVLAFLIVGGAVFVWRDGFGLLAADPSSAVDNPWEVVPLDSSAEPISDPLTGYPAETTPEPDVVSQPTPTQQDAVATVAVVSSATSEVQPLATSLCDPDMAFVADVTIPDRTSQAPGSGFEKVWRVRSSGCANWPADAVLAFVSGDQMGAPDAVDVSVPTVGETTEIAVSMRAPTNPGIYKGRWQMQTSAGKWFGQEIWVEIFVPQPATATVDPRPTVSIPIQNDTGEAIRLLLNGPMPYDLSIKTGASSIFVIEGTYSYTAEACGTQTTGTIDLDATKADWRFWCESS